ncbi:hypothetical protein RUM43_008305 [Polyplax serrata]|uniref:Uncharacterized protein n=1 Tax=Polyplax serrata TaxID=468196 RepID=A0AAN8PNA1_POLSC
MTIQNKSIWTQSQELMLLKDPQEAGKLNLVLGIQKSTSRKTRKPNVKLAPSAQHGCEPFEEKTSLKRWRLGYGFL